MYRYDVTRAVRIVVSTLRAEGVSPSIIGETVTAVADDVKTRAVAEFVRRAEIRAEAFKAECQGQTLATDFDPLPIPTARKTVRSARVADHAERNGNPNGWNHV